MTILSVDIGGGYIDAVVSSDSNPHRQHCILLTKGAALCSCEAHHYGKIKFCKHIGELLTYLKASGINIGESIEMKELPRLLEVGPQGFKEIFGGLPLGELFGIFAKAKANKTIFTHEMAVQGAIETGCNIISEDTEGSNGLHVLPLWLKRWNKRFGGDIALEYMRIDLREWSKREKKAKSDELVEVPYKTIIKAPPNKQKLIVIDTEDLTRLMLLHGKIVRIDYGKGSGKVQMYVQPKSSLYRYIWDVPIARIIEENALEDGGILLLDSLSMPMEEEYTGGQQSFPGRKYANMMLLAQLRKLIREYSMYAIVNTHEIQQDSAMIKQKPTAVGGAGVDYNFKFFMEIHKVAIGSGTQEAKEARRTQRDLIPRRHPHFKEEYLVRRIKLTDEGVFDV